MNYPQKTLDLTKKFVPEATKEIEAYFELLNKALEAKEGTEKYKAEIGILKAELEYILEQVNGLMTYAENENEEWDTVVFMIRNLEGSMRVAIKKYVVAAKKVKARPTVLTWNNIMAQRDSPLRVVSVSMNGFKIVMKKLEKVPEEYNHESSPFHKVFAKIKEFAGDAQKLVDNDTVKKYTADADKKVVLEDNFESDEDAKEEVLKRLAEVNSCAKLFLNDIFNKFDIYEDSLDD